MEPGSWVTSWGRATFRAGLLTSAWACNRKRHFSLVCRCILGDLCYSKLTCTITNTILIKMFPELIFKILRPLPSPLLFQKWIRNARSKYVPTMQLALHIHGFCLCGFNQQWGLWLVEPRDAELVDTEHQLRPIRYKGLELLRILVSAEGLGTNIPQIPGENCIFLQGYKNIFRT